MKRILEKSPVMGYQLFRFVKEKADGTTPILPNYYIRHRGKDTCTETDRLSVAKAAVKKQAGDDAHSMRRRSVSPAQVTIGELLDLVIDNYRAKEQKTLKDAKAKIENSLRPFYGAVRADRLDTKQINKWIAWRRDRRLRKSIRCGHAQLQAASINRELSLSLRAYNLGYEREPQMVDRVPPIKKLPENNIRKGFVSPAQYRGDLGLVR